MTYTSVTSFRRPVTADQLKHHRAAQQPLPPSGVSKWEALRALATARTAYGLSDRDLTVLQALVSFHPATQLDGACNDLVVHPSNKSICERLNGMPCSTMRRHLSHLVEAGFVLRRDSPNGKRYARRLAGEKVAYGFDLSPLARRFDEISQAADRLRVAQERHKRLRTKVSLMRRDLMGLVTYGQNLRPDLTLWDEGADVAALTARDMRRQLSYDDLERLEATLTTVLDTIRTRLDRLETADLSTNDNRNEQHYQNSHKDSNESEIDTEKALGKPLVPATPAEPSDVAMSGPKETQPTAADRPSPDIPLSMILQTCTEYRTYADRTVRHWHDLICIADLLSRMMGISASAWDEAKRHMGPEQAAVVVVAMLERFQSIRCPGAYLRSLTAKAQIGAFSCVPMVMALARKEAA